MRQRAAGCLIIIILCAMCMTGTSLPTIGGSGSADTSMFEDLDFSFDQVPVNDDYAISFKRDASSDAQPSAVQAIASDSGCVWSEDDSEFTIPEGSTCLFALAASEDNVTQLRLLLSQGDTLLVTLSQPDEMTQGGNPNKPVNRLSYDNTPTPTPSPTPLAAATVDPNATSTPTPTPTPTSAAAVPVYPTATPMSYQMFQDKSGILSMGNCTFYEDAEVEEGLTPEIRSCTVLWVQGDNTGDVWWKGWVAGDYTWSGLFTGD